MNKGILNSLLGNEARTEKAVKTAPMVYLGGTTNSNWRSIAKSQLKFDCIDPTRPGAGLESQEVDSATLQKAAMNLFVVTPKQTGFQGIAQLTAAAIKNPQQTVVTFLYDDDGSQFTESQLADIKAVKDMLKIQTDAQVVETLEEATRLVNASLLAPVGADLQSQKPNTDGDHEYR